MKKIIITIALIMINVLGFSQEEFDTEPNPNFAPPSEMIYVRDTVNRNREKAVDYVFNVKFHFIKNNDGTGVTANFGEAECMNAMKILNTSFNKYRIYFKYRGFDEIKNTYYMKVRSAGFTGSSANLTNPLFDDMVSYSQTMPNPVYDPTAFNIFVNQKLNENTSGNSTANGIAYLPGISSVFCFDKLLSETLPHEIGHNFNLQHTWNQWNVSGKCDRVDGVQEQLQLGQAPSWGDFVADTPANYSYPTFNGNQDSNCNFIPSNPAVTDCANNIYGTLGNQPPVKNFMSSQNICRVLGPNYDPGNANFTNGQSVRMRETIRASVRGTLNFGPIYNNTITTIQSLYEPFESSCVPCTVALREKNGLRGYTSITQMCRKQRFQKGFTYSFPDAINTDPTTATTSQIPLNKWYTTNYRMFISQINNNLMDLSFPNVPLVVCPSFRQDDDFIEGTVFSTANLGSTIMTTQELNQSEAIDPELIEKLEDNKYHIITKTTETGFIDQTVIRKP